MKSKTFVMPKAAKQGWEKFRQIMFNSDKENLINNFLESGSSTQGPKTKIISNDNTLLQSYIDPIYLHLKKNKDKNQSCENPFLW